MHERSGALARPSDGAHCHRGLEATHKVSFVVDFHSVMEDNGRSDGCPRWQPASMARQSWPQAMATALMAFMTPLLCVAALYGSEAAKW